MTPCWRWVANAAENNRVLLLEGYIVQEKWYDDEVCPDDFRDALFSGQGDIIVRINSPGGSAFAGAQIYNMLKEYPGKVTVHVDALAASAASLIAMAGDEVLFSPVGTMMIHDPETVAYGDEDAMEAGKNLLVEVKEAALNAYEAKTGRSRDELAAMMKRQTWMSAHKAVDLGFADGILYTDEGPREEESPMGFLFDRETVVNMMTRNTRPPGRPRQAEKPAKTGVPVDTLRARLDELRPNERGTGK